MKNKTDPTNLINTKNHHLLGIFKRMWGFLQQVGSMDGTEGEYD
jgi:hypothetical protein